MPVLLLVLVFGGAGIDAGANASIEKQRISDYL